MSWTFQGERSGRPCLAVVVLLALAMESRGEKIYWIRDATLQSDSIHRACVNGSHVHTLLSHASVNALAIDTLNEKVYWTEWDANSLHRLRRANLPDLSNAETIVAGASGDVVVDPPNGKVYFGQGTAMYRANLDGSQVESLLGGGPAFNIRRFALDAASQKLYWTDSSNKRIVRANIDGSNQEILHSLPTNLSPHDIVIDTLGQRVYWSTWQSISGYLWISSSNLDGTNVQTFSAGQNYGVHRVALAIDVPGRKLYWTRPDGNFTEVIRSALNGSNIEILFSDWFIFPSEIALDLRPCGGMDCQPNGSPDDCDTCNGISADCNLNDVPDECEPDCDSDGTPDDCDPDCNSNGTSDICDIVSGASLDVLPIEGDRVPDECQTDCNGNLIPDSEDLSTGQSQDCNQNAVPDECDVLGSSSVDCDENGVPDECQPDCNANGHADTCDIASGSSTDCGPDGIPDECQPDCNLNGSPDSCDLSTGVSVDVNENGRPDECDPPNDLCESATPMCGGAVGFDPTGALNDGPPEDWVDECDVLCDSACDGPDVWFDFVAPDSGIFQATVLIDGWYSPSLIIYAECDCPVSPADAVACLVSLSGTTEVTFSAEVDQCYKIQAEYALFPGTLVIERLDGPMTPCIPTVSAWGLSALALLLGIVGTMTIRRDPAV